MVYRDGWRHSHRPRRLRQSEPIRSLIRETVLTPDDFIAPLFIVEGEGVREPIGAMPEQYRLSVDNLLREAEELVELGIRGVALFPAISEDKKDSRGSEALNPEGLIPRAVSALKERFGSQLLVITDVALDPYSSDGHDGIVREGKIVNDETLEVLAEMALVQARAGADIVAPSDMMDGRVGFIRNALDSSGFSDVAIISYTAKYASALYGPFRSALDSAPRKREGIPEDKRSYQMDPANAREAERELFLDIEEGADIAMVKPAGFYLDVIARLKSLSSIPIAAYQVSGEYSMIYAGAERGLFQLEPAVLESLISIKRAGADVIFTYFAKMAVKFLNS